MSNGAIIASKEDAIRWSRDAQVTLETAQKLCTIAQASLHNTANELSFRLPDLLEAAEFLFDSLKRQYDIINKALESLEKLISEKIDKYINEFESILDPTIDQLDKIILQLKHTNIPAFLLENNQNESPMALADFISNESINLLRDNIEIYKSNCKKIQTIIQQSYQTTIQEPHTRMKKQYSKIVKLFDSLAPIQLELKSQSKESNGLIATILRENSSLENELVSLLEMMTNHYDQCVKAVDLLSAGSRTGINLEVLAGDAQELPDVAKELNAVYGIILKNEERAHKFLTSNNSNIENTINMIEKELEDYRNYKTLALPKFMILLSECEKRILKISIDQQPNKTPCEQYAEVLQELAFHYTQFIDVYKSKYLTELHHELYSYPRKFLKKLTEFLQEDLYRIEREESERRRNWMIKYGDFIPKEFKLPGEYELPQIVQVLTEGLEHIQVQEEFNEGKEKELLDLIKRTKSV
ncbi:ATG17 [[Candida] subhashii]|uniref:Autophagy-related protein 17 n=1 Tax=[Candida] subhashii TaxID=561895 RepID=A0A8J5QQI5_9ASCO|nr:ATG17 [[Candida] subhashii]KAG7664613.1 ATG17 [[Candida] subhashii]